MKRSYTAAGDKGQYVCVSACACDTEGEDKSDEADLLSWWRWCLHKSAIAEELTES